MESNHTDTYNTLAAKGSGSYRDRGSKFIGIAFPVSSEDDIRTILNHIRNEYHDATHHCYAYRIGHNPPVFRFHDDGEPSGSAGKPIYGQLLSLNLFDVLVVVIRYYGGVKLGVPGLINAYRTAARGALECGGSVKKFVLNSVTVEFEFPMMNNVMRILRNTDAKITRQSYEGACSITFSIRKSLTEKAIEELSRSRSIRIINSL
jgi:uncharacterized YigZ family protein